MRHWLFCSLTLLSVGSFAQAPAASPEYQPKEPIRNYFLGAWKLAGTEVRYPDGHTTPYVDLGSHAVGFLLYTPSGHMCAQLMKPGRPKWASMELPTPAESASALDGFTSYCGTFEIREKDRTIIHRPETAGNPGMVGTDQPRPYHFVSQNRFFFRGEETIEQKDGTKSIEIWTISWERLGPK